MGFKKCKSLVFFRTGKWFPVLSLNNIVVRGTQCSNLNLKSSLSWEYHSQSFSLPTLLEMSRFESDAGKLFHKQVTVRVGIFEIT